MSGLRQRKRAAVKRAFFEAAIELFRERGYDETSVDEIAARAGLSRATFFNHFGAKEGLLRYYGEYLAARVDRLVEELDPDSPALDRIRRLLWSMVREAEQHREELRLITAIRVKDPAYLRGLTSPRQRIWDVLAGLLAEARKRGELPRGGSARDLAYHVLSVYNGVVLGVVGETGTTKMLFDSAWRFILAALRGEGR